MSNFDQSSQFLRKSQKNTLFCHFLLKMVKKLTKILKIYFELLFGLKTSKQMLRFLIFAIFLLIFLVSCQIRSKIQLFTKFSNFWPYFACNSTNQQKLTKMRKHLMGCFKSKKEFKINFWIFCLFLAYFEQKVPKNKFLWFSQKLWFLVKI